MGQTLPNGIYLPAEGERNCYDGLEGNWRSLDSLISTVAGKASATHTHGNITNDGKLTNGNRAVITGSDKAITESSVTDTELGYLSGVTSAIQTQLNAKATDSDVVHKSGNESIGGKKTFTDSVFCKGSFFLWTNAKVVKGTVPQTTIQPYRMYFGDAQNYANSLFNIDSAVGNDGTQTFTFRAAENVVNGDDARFSLVYNPNRTQPRYLSIKGGIEPNATNTYDLGSSSSQWNNVYSKNYFYNGTAWGLDKANVWTNTNTFQQNITYERTNFFHQAANPDYVLVDTGLEIGTVPTTPRTAYPGLWQDKNNQSLGYVRFVQYDAGVQTFECDIRNKVSNGSFNTEGSLQMAGFQIVNNPSSPIGTCNVYANVNPNSDNTYALGSTTRRWKTLNGTNPGALSLPGGYTSSVTEYITDKTGGNNNVYTAPADGWVGIQASSATLDSTNFVFMGRTSDGTTYYAQNASSPINAYWSNLYHGCILLPVIGGKTYGIRCKCDSVDARFYKANGNVS